MLQKPEEKFEDIPDMTEMNTVEMKRYVILFSCFIFHTSNEKKI
jgi:hypothetical protein